MDDELSSVVHILLLLSMIILVLQDFN